MVAYRITVQNFQVVKLLVAKKDLETITLVHALSITIYHIQVVLDYRALMPKVKIMEGSV